MCRAHTTIYVRHIYVSCSYNYICAPYMCPAHTTSVCNVSSSYYHICVLYMSSCKYVSDVCVLLILLYVCYMCAPHTSQRLFSTLLHCLRLGLALPTRSKTSSEASSKGSSKASMLHCLRLCLALPQLVQLVVKLVVKLLLHCLRHGLALPTTSK